MKLIDAIKVIDKSSRNSSSLDEESFYSNLELQYDYSIDLTEHEFSAYYLAVWLCTDEWVGTRAIFYQDKFICIDHKSARKANHEYIWLNKETKEKIRNIVFSLQKPNFSNETFTDLNEEIGTGYKIEFTSEIMHEMAKHIPSGEMVYIHSKHKCGSISRKVNILFKDGRNEIVNTNQLEFPWGVCVDTLDLS